MGEKHANIYVPCEFSPKHDLAEEDIHNQVNRKIRLRDTSQPLSSATPLLLPVLPLLRFLLSGTMIRCM